MTWDALELVNDNQGVNDGLSGTNYLNANPNADITGRTTFQPELAVDQSTGTLVISGAMPATTPPMPASPPTSPPASTVARLSGPRHTPTHQKRPSTPSPVQPTSSGRRPTTSRRQCPDRRSLRLRRSDGSGRRDGQIYPIWAGNFFGPTGDPNDSFFNFTTGVVNAYPLNIWYQPMTIAAGPRIISSTMGRVVDTTLSGSAIDLPQFVPPAGSPSLTPTSSTIPISGDPSLMVAASKSPSLWTIP